MGFTITCNECGNSQVFKDNDRCFQDNIELHLEQSMQYGNNPTTYLAIYCENEKCNKWADIKL